MGSDVFVPRAGRDYPATWQAFEAWFVDEDACREYLVRLRWPHGFVCPVCGASGWQTATKRWMCSSCGRQTSVTAGTIFHRTRTPLKIWFAAIWFVCAQKNGTSAKSLQQVLGFGSYETAWAWLHKLRRAMVRPERELLGGPGQAVELDETNVGGRSTGMSGPRYANKAKVVIAVERLQPKGLGRVRLRHIDPTTLTTEVAAFAQASIAPGSVVYTDGAKHYQRFARELDLTHEPIALVHAADPAHEILPAVHRIAALLKRWLAGTLHHGQSFEHLDYYLDEFTFRFNRRTSRSRGLLFYRLLQQALNTDPHPLNDLTATQSDDLS